MPENTKCCAKCEKVKLIIEFYQTPRVDDYCKVCKRKMASEYHAVRRLDPVYVEKRRVASQKNRKKNANNLELRKKHCEHVKKYAEANKDNPDYIARRKAAARRFRQKNKGKVNAWKANRDAAKIQACPKWLTTTQHDEITELYILAADLSWLCDGGLQVDHIIPLLGKNVRGLHVPWNLQIIPAIENNKKNNKIH